jgi:hypothetical protein
MILPEEAPRGRSRRELAWPALTMPLPDWLPASLVGGTASLTAGVLRIQGTGGTLALKTIGVDLTVHRAIGFTVENVAADWHASINAGISLKDDAGTLGVAIYQTATGQPTAMLRLLGAGVPDVPIHYVWAGPELTKHRNLTLAIGCDDRSVWLMEDGQVMHHGLYPQLRLGAVRGVLDAAVSTGVTRALYTSQVRLAVETS